MKPVAGTTRCDRAVTFRVLLIFIVILSGLGAAGWYYGSRRYNELIAAELGLVDAEKLVASLSERPTAEELASARSALASAEEKLAETETDLAAKREAYDAEAADATRLRAALEEAGRTSRERETQVEGLQARLAGLAEQIKRLDTELRSAKENFETARRAASGKADLLAKLDEAATRSAELEGKLAGEGEKLAQKDEALAKADEALRKTGADLAERDELVGKLKAELADIPVMPLPDALARQRFREFLKEVAGHTDRENRVAILFRAKLALSGSSFESKANAAWKKEHKLKQEDLERRAKAVYGDVSSKIHLHAEAHEENVRLLTEALEELRGSRYEKIVKQLIDREHELEAAGR